MRLADQVTGWTKFAQMGTDAESVLSNYSELPADSPEANNAIQQFGRIGQAIAARPNALGFEEVFKNPSDMQAAQQGISDGIGEKLQSTMGGMWAKSSSEAPTSSFTQRGWFGRQADNLWALNGSTNLSTSMLGQQAEQNILDGAKKAFGAGDPAKVRENTKNMVLERNMMPAASAGTKAEQLQAPVAAKIQSSMATAIKNNSNMPTPVKMMNSISSLFGEQEQKVAADTLDQMGQAMAAPFTPDCPAIKGFADDFTKRIVSPGYSQGMDTHAGAPLKMMSSLMQGDFGGAVDSLFGGLGGALSSVFGGAGDPGQGK